MELKYKEREVTNMVRVIFEPEEKTTREIYVEQRKNGLFNIGYHLIVLPDGEVKRVFPFLLMLITDWPMCVTQYMC